jgi:DNA repair exonuclease SbcCD ATPase subunit
MGRFFGKLFGKKNEENDESLNENELLRDQISAALEKCKKERDSELKTIENVNKWAKDLILEIFDVPSAYWYDELNEYEQIKFHENNLNISQAVLENTDKVIEEYREQIKLSESKIHFLETLSDEYNEILKKLDSTIKRAEALSEEEQQLELLKNHKKRLAQMKSETANFDEIYQKTGALEVLNDDIKKIEEDFSIKLEVSKYVEQLDKEFAGDVDNIDSLPVRKEIDEITEELKKK